MARYAVSAAMPVREGRHIYRVRKSFLPLFLTQHSALNLVNSYGVLIQPELLRQRFQ